MITATYTFYWYDMTSAHQLQDKVLTKSYTWTLASTAELDRYAKYTASNIGAFKYELYSFSVER